MEIIAVTDYKKLYMRLKQFSKNKYIAIWLVVLKMIYINRRIRPFTLLYILFPSSRSPHSCFSIAKYAVIGQKPFRRPSRFSPFFTTSRNGVTLISLINPSKLYRTFFRSLKFQPNIKLFENPSFLGGACLSLPGATCRNKITELSCG